MQNYLFLLLIFVVKLRAELKSATSSCAKYSFDWTNELPKCNPYDYCLMSDDHESRITDFSTKTAYRLNESHAKHEDFHVENCSPHKIWLLVRHGTRLPTAKGIRRFSELEKFRDEIVQNGVKLKKQPLCLKDWEMFQNWKWNHSITERQANYLMPQGYKELSSIARVYKRYLPTLFQSPYDRVKFHFRHTNTERTRSSFRAFFDELFGENAHTKIDAVSPLDRPDHLLKAYANCHLWIEQKQQLKRSDSEFMKFENSKQFKQIIADIDARFGFNGTLSPARIKDIYNACRYEQAWQPNKASIWCSLFTASQIRALEYREDLTYFYKSGPGSKLNKNIKCAAMNDMIRRLNNSDGPPVTAYFSHSAALQLLLTSLGALQDEFDLKAEHFAKMSVRKWKTSKICPFATNIAIVRYKCSQHDQVKFFLNQKPLHFDWCNANGVCDWQDFQKRYAFYANANCDQIFCRKDL